MNKHTILFLSLLVTLFQTPCEAIKALEFSIGINNIFLCSIYATQKEQEPQSHISLSIGVCDLQPIINIRDGLLDTDVIPFTNSQLPKSILGLSNNFSSNTLNDLFKRLYRKKLGNSSFNFQKIQVDGKAALHQAHIELRNGEKMDITVKKSFRDVQLVPQRSVDVTNIISKFSQMIHKRKLKYPSLNSLKPFAKNCGGKKRRLRRSLVNCSQGLLAMEYVIIFLRNMLSLNAIISTTLASLPTSFILSLFFNWNFGRTWLVVSAVISSIVNISLFHDDVKKHIFQFSRYEQMSLASDDANAPHIKEDIRNLNAAYHNLAVAMVAHEHLPDVDLVYKLKDLVCAKQKRYQAYLKILQTDPRNFGIVESWCGWKAAPIPSYDRILNLKKLPPFHTESTVDEKDVIEIVDVDEEDVIEVVVGAPEPEINNDSTNSRTFVVEKVDHDISAVAKKLQIKYLKDKSMIRMPMKSTPVLTPVAKKHKNFFVDSESVRAPTLPKFVSNSPTTTSDLREFKGDIETGNGMSRWSGSPQRLPATPGRPQHFP